MSYCALTHSSAALTATIIIDLIVFCTQSIYSLTLYRSFLCFRYIVRDFQFNEEEFVQSRKERSEMETDLKHQWVTNRTLNTAKHTLRTLTHFKHTHTHIRLSLTYRHVVSFLSLSLFLSFLLPSHLLCVFLPFVSFPPPLHSITLILSLSLFLSISFFLSSSLSFFISF